METYYVPIRFGNAILQKYLLIEIASYAFYTGKIITLFRLLSKNTGILAENEKDAIR